MTARNVCVVSAHPDDETLGCGGTLLRHADAGDRLFWLIATEPDEPRWSRGYMERAAAQVESVAGAYAVQRLFRLGFPAARLDTVPQAELIESIAGVVSEVRPEIVYLVHDGDVHTDHHAVFVATFSAIKSFCTKKLGVRRVLSYECLSSTEAAPAQRERAFIPNVYCDITSYIEQKLRVMALYETEVQADPLPRGPSAIRALARCRGAAVGLEYAEAFMLMREID